MPEKNPQTENSGQPEIVYPAGQQPGEFNLIDPAKVAELKSEKHVGTNNLLTFRQKVRAAFRTVSIIAMMAAVVASGYLILTTHTNLRTRLKLIPTSLQTIWNQLPVAGVAIVAGVLALAVILRFLSRRSIIVSILVGLVFMLFWLAAAYWLYSVLGLGLTTLNRPF